MELFILINDFLVHLPPWSLNYPVYSPSGSQLNCFPKNIILFNLHLGVKTPLGFHHRGVEIPRCQEYHTGIRFRHQGLILQIFKNLPKLDRDNNTQTGLWTTLGYLINCDSCLQKCPILRNSNQPRQRSIYSTKKRITNTWHAQLHCSRKRTRWGRKWRAGGGWREAATGRSPWRHPPGWRWTRIWHRRPGSPRDPRVSTCSTLEDSS